MFAQKSVFKLTLDTINEKTIVKNSFFTPPFKLMRNFYDKKLTSIYVLNSSAGIFKEDHLSFEIICKKNTNTAILTQSYEKVYDTKNSFASKNIDFTLEENAIFFYMPKPLLLQENANFIQNTKINLASFSRLVYVDFVIFGRVAMDEKFAFKNYESLTQIYRNDTLILNDKIKINPSYMKENELNFFANHTHYLSIYLFGYDEFYEELKASFDDINQLFYEGLCIKILSNESEKLLLLQNKLFKFCQNKI
ncbi:Urease accessory protein UreH [Campylobacter lari]|uniref:urease accessory protein UreD n=1 Tax=Campylobacter lari TaxID=201 RepID=UPI000DF0FE05|nr:urease accessory protein UreD [Campylobacter lari]STA73316.1 Urease accessory protein UreH [Campylobacter lari]